MNQPEELNPPFNIRCNENLISFDHYIQNKWTNHNMQIIQRDKENIPHESYLEKYSLFSSDNQNDNLNDVTLTVFVQVDSCYIDNTLVYEKFIRKVNFNNRSIYIFDKNKELLSLSELSN